MKHQTITAAPDLERLKTALEVMARLVLVDPVYAPVFERIEREIAAAEAAAGDDLLERARAAVILQKAIG